MNPFSQFSNRFPTLNLRLKWGFWFTVSNIIMSWIIGIKYLTFIFPLELAEPRIWAQALITLFVILTYLSYLAFLTTAYFSITLIPLLLLSPSRVIVKFFAVIFSGIYLCFLLSDSLIFIMFRFHVTTVLLKMVFSREVFAVFNPSTFESMTIIGIAASLFILEYLLLKLSWYWVLFKHERRLKLKVMISIIAAIILSCSIYFISIALKISIFSQEIKVLPYYTQLLAILSPHSHALNNIERYRESKFMQLRQATAHLNYPITPLHCQAPQHPFNIVWIIIDTWRLNTLNQKFTPEIKHYLNRGLYFSHHDSGGNCTQPGIFSLFYSIPNNYWTSMTEQQVGPVFIDELQRQNYQIGIFASASLVLPAFYKNVFLHIPSLKLAADGDFPADKDRHVTAEFTAFLKNRPKDKPFFSFLFYDAAHAYCTKQNYSKPFQPFMRHCLRMSARTDQDKMLYMNRYFNALHFVDAQVGSVLQQLQKAQLMDNTVIILTGDHGQEFDDNHLGYWEHASNYTPYQVQTPLLILWPQHQAKRITALTTHYDIVPTLMRHVLGCQSPIADYSIGRDLFEQPLTPLNFVIAGSYINFGIITADGITIIYPSGNIETQDLSAKPLDVAPNDKLIIQVLNILRQYYTQQK